MRTRFRGKMKGRSPVRRPRRRWVNNIKIDLPEVEWENVDVINPLNPELNPICYLLALLGAHHFLHVSRIRVKLLTLR